ncbi:hypothetical protein NFI96_020728, partial [Prochilodus magdalenae]
LQIYPLCSFGCNGVRRFGGRPTSKLMQCYGIINALRIVALVTSPRMCQDLESTRDFRLSENTTKYVTYELELPAQYSCTLLDGFWTFKGEGGPANISLTGRAIDLRSRAGCLTSWIRLSSRSSTVATQRAMPPGLWAVLAGHY